MNDPHRTTILSLGGSIVVPGAIDRKYLIRFRRMILRLVRRGHRFVIVVGGGQTNRTYNAAITAMRRVPDADLDWLGIAATRLNAELVRILVAEVAHPRVIDDPRTPISGKRPIILAAGWKPGCSTDKDAVLWAQRFHAKQIINLTDIPYVYDRDPGRSASAQPIRSLSWADYRRMIQRKWTPRMSSPFDPVASALAQKLGLRVIILNGRRLRNLEHAILREPFVGTLIS